MMGHSMAKKKAKRKAPAKAARKPAAKRRVHRQIVIKETFSLPARQQEFKKQRIAPPEEPIAIAQPGEHSHANKSAIPHWITATVGSLVATCLVAAFLTMGLGMSPVYTFGISAAVFVGFSILFYTMLATSQ
jgi:hypothetical protein